MTNSIGDWGHPCLTPDRIWNGALWCPLTTIRAQQLLYIYGFNGISKCQRES